MRTGKPAPQPARAVIAHLAFSGTVAFYALVALPLARRELARWSQRAAAIKDPVARNLALTTLRDEKANSQGAAAFAVLYPPATTRLVPLLVAYQLAWDFVDSVLECPGATLGTREAARRCLELAVLVDRQQLLAHVPPDAGDAFLNELVRACRSACKGLPSYGNARPSLGRILERSDALLITNGPSSVTSATLTAWARRHASQPGLEPAELCAAGHCSLGIHALLATAASPKAARGEFEAIEMAYDPWVDALCTLLDSVVDQEQDDATGAFSFVRQYRSPSHAAARLREIASRSMCALDALPAPNRHRALIAALVGMYLSSEAAQSPAAHAVVDGVLEATAPLSHLGRVVGSLQRRVLG